MILKLTKIKLNPFSANPSKDISLSSAVKFGKCYSYILNMTSRKILIAFWKGAFSFPKVEVGRKGEE